MIRRYLFCAPYVGVRKPDTAGQGWVSRAVCIRCSEGKIPDTGSRMIGIEIRRVTNKKLRGLPRSFLLLNFKTPGQTEDLARNPKTWKQLKIDPGNIIHGGIFFALQDRPGYAAALY